MDEHVIAAGKYLVQLLGNVLKNEQPEEKPENISFETLYNMAKFHRVECMAYYGVEKMRNKPEPELNQEWCRSREQHISRSYTQLAERDSILNSLTRANIAVLPLKGCLLKEMYPQIDFRQMADLDILINSLKADESKGIMEQLGYTAKQFDLGNHDVYERIPYMEIELHRAMINESCEMHSYYRDVWNKAVPDEARPYYFHFSWNDYYIFMLIHFAKHYYGGGSGIRSIMDIYVFLEKYGNKLDQAYLKQELEKLDLYSFKEQAEMLVNVWFDHGEKNSQTIEMEQYVITSGIYGTRIRSVDNQLKKLEKKVQSRHLARLIYFFNRMFPDYKIMCSIYHSLKSMPVLLPFCWVHRLMAAMITKRTRVAEEFKALKQHD